MSYFLFPSKLQEDELAKLTGDEARHLAMSRRVKIGEIIELQDSDYKRFNAKIIAIGKRDITLKILQTIIAPEEPQIKITLCQALISEQALDIIIQKTTELGVSNIIIFQAKNSPHSITKDIEKKLSRWNKIAVEAAKQCGRVYAPKITFLESIYNTLSAMDKNILKIALDASGKLFSQTKSAKKLTALNIFIGPEGGWTPEELTLFSKNNISITKFGPRTLRAETAAIAAIAIIGHIYGDM